MWAEISAHIGILYLIVGVDGIVGSEVEAATLLALQGPAGDEITHIDHIAQFTDVLRSFDALEEALCLLIKHVETIPSTMEAQVGTHDADIVRHDLVDFLDALGDEHLLLIGHRALIVPLRHLCVVVVEIDMGDGVFGCSVGIDNL